MKNIKAILFDVDGVLIKPKHSFSKELELKGYKNAEDSLNVYYRGLDDISSLEGRTDIKELIIPYLKKFGWEHSADEYLKQQFEYEQKFLDKEMFHIIDKLRTQGLKCCLATDQEKHRARYLLDTMNFRNIFDIHYISCYMGVFLPQYSFKVVKELSANGVCPYPLDGFKLKF